MMRKILPVIIIVLLALVTSYIYFTPLLSGKRLMEHDRLTAYGAQKESKDYYKQTKIVTQWSNSMFGGMPNTTFWNKNKSNITIGLRKIEKIGIYPASFLVILILSSFLCLILFGVNPWLSIVGALSYSFASHYFILIGAGHITKIWALAYLAPLIASIYMTFNGKKLLGALLTMIFLSIEISAVHPQITYYGVIVVLLFGITGLIFAIKSKTVKDFFISALYLIIPLILAIGTNANYLLTTQEYTQYSTRGGTILSSDSEKQDKGLSADYILDYSYDVTEALTAFVPRLKGGSMSEPLGENSKLYAELSKSQGKQQAKKTIQNIPLYWGSQPIVSGPFYFGAITIFLFVLGLFAVKGRDKWWLASVVLISFLLSLGRYFPSLSHFAIDYLPLYNKFRDVKNIVFIQNIAMWLLGILALKEIFQNRNQNEKQYLNALKYSTIIAGGIALVFAVIPSLAGNFTGNVDAQLVSSGWSARLLDALKADRISVARTDSFRSLIFVLLAAGTIWLVLKKKLKTKYALIIAAIFVLADLWPVNKRYLNDDNFVSKRKADVPFTPTSADKAILNDKNPDYRVLNMAINPWNDASTSYFHKSIGGYSGAKLRRYQDMIENHLSPEMQQIGARLRNVKTQADVDAVFFGLNSLNMLNAKYIIYNPDAAPLLNNSAMGNAWFIENIKLVENANEEIDLINKVNISSDAIISNEFEKLLPKTIQIDSLASIKLITYAPNKLVYQSSTNTDQLAVFSEIYYPKGWIAMIDGIETNYFRANYILRAMAIPAGNHKITFEFKPKSYEIGNKVSFASSLLMLLAIAGVVFVEIRKRKTIKSNEA